MTAVRSTLLTTFCLTVIALGFAAASVAAQDAELSRLQRDWALRFFEPDAHMELAKYYRAKGDLINAFYVLENARRNRFEAEVFDAAFLKHFGGFAPLDNSPAEEQKYRALRSNSPDDIKVIIHLADIYVSRNDFAKAEPLFKEVLVKDPRNATAVGALAEIYSRQNKTDDAMKVRDDFAAKFPTEAYSYWLRIARLAEKDNAAARKLLDEGLKAYPANPELINLVAFFAESDGMLDEAEKIHVKAAELGKSNTHIQARAAIFFRTKRNDKKTALKYYLNTYFLDPHAHFDGHAEAKVAGINGELAKERVEREFDPAGKNSALLADPNPIVVIFTLAKLQEKWDRSDRDIFVQMLRHEDVLVRWSSMLILREKEDFTFLPVLAKLLVDDDLRVRGLAIYLAVSMLKEKSFPDVRRLLSADAQLLRFDAVSALLMYGGEEGEKIVKEHAVKERSAYLLKMIEAAMNSRGN
jgi:tetratricopeptide (TPR) repeat protein